jgi:nucleoside-diphosphate-sugar epimerase
VTTPSLTGKRLVVTGCTGQVGGAVARALAADNDIIGLARFGDADKRAALEADGIRCESVDLAKPDLREVPTDVDHVLHFAVTKSGKWRTDLAANGEAVGHLMAHFAGVESFLHCSSTAVYAPNGGGPMAEDDPLGDHHHDMMPTYSIAKISAETTARFAANHFGVPTTIARLNVPYGDEGGWPFFHLLMLRGAMPIPVHSDGSTYNPIHHDDIVAHLPALLAAASTPATTVNWAGDDVVSIADWVAHLAAVAGIDEPDGGFVVESDTALPSAAIDTTRQHELIGGCGVGWRDGFARMVAANPAAPAH